MFELTWTGRRCRRTRLRCWRPAGRWLWRWKCCRWSGGTELSAGRGPEEGPDPDLNSLLGCGEPPRRLRETEKWHFRYFLDYFKNLLVPFNSSIVSPKILAGKEDFFTVLQDADCCCCTWTGVVVDFICRDSDLCALSFPLHNSQLLLGGVEVGKTTRTRLRLELEQDHKTVSLDIIWD